MTRVGAFPRPQLTTSPTYSSANESAAAMLHAIARLGKHIKIRIE